tara:strand:- start:421 stop:1443 length:1023 start_codon:yes stop_codon:yes gene_type:complete
MIQLSKEIELDADVTSVSDIRFNNTLSRQFIIKDKSGEVSEELTEYFDKAWFKFWQEQVLQSILWGYTLFKVGNIVDDEVTEIESLKREFYNPTTKELLKQYTDLKGCPIDEGDMADWVFECTPYSELNNYQGLYTKLAPYSIYSKEAMQNLADLLSRFGVPQAIIKTHVSDEESVRNLENYLQNLSNSSYAILGVDDEIEMVNGASGSGDAFQRQLDESKSSIAKIILGSDVLNTENSFVGSTDVAAAQAGLYSADDIRFVESQFKALRDKLVGLGLNFLEGCTLSIDKENAVTGEDKKFILELLNTGKYKIPLDYLQDKLGIPLEEIEQPVIKDGKED